MTAAGRSACTGLVPDHQPDLVGCYGDGKGQQRIEDHAEDQPEPAPGLTLDDHQGDEAGRIQHQSERNLYSG